MCAIIRHVLSRIEYDVSVKNRFIRTNKEVAQRKGCAASAVQIFNPNPQFYPEKQGSASKLPRLSMIRIVDHGTFIYLNYVSQLIHMTKTDLIHIRIDPEIKEQSEIVLKRLGLNMSYAVSIFLNQVIMRNGLPFNVEITEAPTESERLAEALESTGGNGSVSPEDQKIIHLFATGQIDYETAVFAIERNYS